MFSFCSRNAMSGNVWSPKDNSKILPCNGATCDFASGWVPSDRTDSCPAGAVWSLAEACLQPVTPQPQVEHNQVVSLALEKPWKGLYSQIAYRLHCPMCDASWRELRMDVWSAYQGVLPPLAWANVKHALVADLATALGQCTVRCVQQEHIHPLRELQTAMIVQKASHLKWRSGVKKMPTRVLIYFSFYQTGVF